MQQTPSGATDNGLGTTINEHSAAMHNERRRGQRTGRYDQVSATHNERHSGQRPGRNDQVPAIKYFVNQNAGVGSNLAEAHVQKSWARIQMNHPCSVAAFVVNSEPYTGARPSVRLCAGP
jgi:hypothetical protein